MDCMLRQDKLKRLAAAARYLRHPCGPTRSQTRLPWQSPCTLQKSLSLILLLLLLLTLCLLPRLPVCPSSQSRMDFLQFRV
eukprot:745908-Hanusia_phi.AAC.2